MSLRTPIGMLMFVHVFVPRPKVVGGEPVYNLNLLFDAEAQKDPLYAALKAACRDTIEAKFGKGKTADQNFMRKFMLPFRDAADKTKYPGFKEGMKYIAPWTKSRPGIVDGALREITAASDIWAGQLGRCTVSPFAYEQGSNRGCNFMLNNLQITKADMPRMDGRTNAGQDFDRTEDAGSGGGVSEDNDVPF